MQTDQNESTTCGVCVCVTRWLAAVRRRVYIGIENNCC